MSHPFGCATELVCPSHPGAMFPNLGWKAWEQNGKSIYIRVAIDPSITFRVECGEAIRRWNEQVGARFLMRSDQGDAQITFFEKSESEWPFNVLEWRPNGEIAAAFALNYDSAGNMLGTNPGLIVRCDIYVNRDALSRPDMDHPKRVWIFGHEMGHAFGLADHPNDNALSIMSYRQAGQSLLGPTFEDVHGVAHIYDLHDLLVRPRDLEGFENIETIWWYDRYGKLQTHMEGSWQRWRGFFAAFWGLFGSREWTTINDLKSFEPDENYWLKLKTGSPPTMLGFGRFSQQVFPGQQNIWTYR